MKYVWDSPVRFSGVTTGEMESNRFHQLNILNATAKELEIWKKNKKAEYNNHLLQVSNSLCFGFCQVFRVLLHLVMCPTISSSTSALPLR